MAVDIDEALAVLIQGASAVSTIAGDRVYPNRVPQPSNVPAVIFRRLTAGSAPVIRGKSTALYATFQVESWSGASQIEARTLDLAVQGVANVNSVLVGPPSLPSPGWWIQALRVNTDTDQDNPQIPIHADDLGLFCSFCEMFVQYRALP